MFSKRVLSLATTKMIRSSVTSYTKKTYLNKHPSRFAANLTTNNSMLNLKAPNKHLDLTYQNFKNILEEGVLEEILYACDDLIEAAKLATADEKIICKEAAEFLITRLLDHKIVSIQNNDDDSLTNMIFDLFLVAANDSLEKLTKFAKEYFYSNQLIFNTHVLHALIAQEQGGVEPIIIYLISNSYLLLAMTYRAPADTVDKTSTFLNNQRAYSEVAKSHYESMMNMNHMKQMNELNQHLLELKSLFTHAELVCQIANANGYQFTFHRLEDIKPTPTRHFVIDLVKHHRDSMMDDLAQISLLAAEQSKMLPLLGIANDLIKRISAMKNRIGMEVETATPKTGLRP